MSRIPTTPDGLIIHHTEQFGDVVVASEHNLKVAEAEAKGFKRGVASKTKKPDTALNRYFDRIVVINLARRPDRWRQCKEQIARMGIEAERWEAYDNPTNGHAGCTRSHRELWADIAQMHSRKGRAARVLVFEDDFSAITPDILWTPFLELPGHGQQFPNAQGFRPGHPVWDRFHLILDGKGTADERFSAIEPDLPKRWDVLYLGGSYAEGPIERLNSRVIRVRRMKTTTAYGITSAWAKELTALIDRSMHSTDLAKHPGPVDDVLGNFATRAGYFCIQPRIFYQRPSMSDISGECHNGLFAMTDPVHEGMV